MKLKRGFTLIEMLAVIAVLAVATLIAAPTIINILKKSEAKQYENYLEDLYLAAESYVQTHASERVNLSNPGDVYIVSIKKLREKSLVKKNLVNPKTNKNTLDTDGIEIKVENDLTHRYSFVINVSDGGTLEVTADGFVGVYDGSAHGITVISEGASIKYGTSKDNYNLESSPTYTNVGTYTVYYRVTRTGYKTVTGSKDVVISKAAGELTLSETSGTITYPTAKEVIVTKNKGGGLLSCSTSDSSIATCSVVGAKVTITPGTTLGNVNITITSAATENYNAISTTYAATVESGTLSVTANGYAGTYDGSAHGISVSSSGATIKYGTVAGTYNLESSPTYTNVGTYTVYYEVTRVGYKTVTGSKDVVINKAAGEVTLSETSGTITYPTAKEVTVTKNQGGGALSCTSSNNNIATCSVSGTVVTITPGTTAGSATITVTSAGTSNYNTASASYSATVASGTLSVTANGYTGTYDGNAHGISVSSSGATIRYGTASGTYDKTSSPTYTNAGTYTVYYQVTKTGYTTITGSKTVTINKAAGGVTLSSTSGTVTYPTAKTITVTKNTGGGTLSCSSSSNSIATCAVSGTSVTITPGTTAGNANIIVTSAATTNYNAASATYTVTVEKGTLSVTANGYTGTYDGSAHGISVSSSGATIKYGTSSGTYDRASSPTYTNAGTYTVYYEVSKAGYNTVTGSKTVTINKAAGSITLDKTSGSLTYPAVTNINITSNRSGGYISCTSSNASIASCYRATDTMVAVDSETTAGTATITITSAATTNYNAATATYTVTVASGTLSVTANGYEGTYNGTAHGITVSSNGATIKYGTTAGTYNLESSPTYSDAGIHRVYYQVTRPGYTTVTGSQTVTIYRAAGGVTLSSTSGTATYPTAKTITVTKNTSGGNLSCSTSNSSIATCSVSGTTVTVTPGTTAGTATLTITSAQTTNYNAASTSYSATVASGTLSVTANGWSGAYDGSYHGITVTSSGATIKYGTTAGTYNLTSSPTYTDPGTYTVYYQVTRAGYTTVTGSKTIEISKANGELTLSETSGSLAYPEEKAIAITNHKGGKLSCSSSRYQIVTCEISDSPIDPSSPYNMLIVKSTGSNIIDKVTATITVRSAETEYYKATTTTYTITVDRGTIDVEEKTYIGPYDGKLHWLEVTPSVSGTTIKYNWQEETEFTRTEVPKVSVVGTWKTCYQVSRPGYKPKTGCAYIKIYPLEDCLYNYKKAFPSDTVVLNGSYGSKRYEWENICYLKYKCATTNADIVLCDTRPDIPGRDYLSVYRFGSTGSGNAKIAIEAYYQDGTVIPNSKIYISVNA